MMIKFLDLKSINQNYSDELHLASKEVIGSGWYLFGEQVKKFENNLANYIGVKYAVGVASGFDALKLIFMAYLESGFMKDGDEIIVPANTYIASILAITETRLKPVFIEPDINTYNLDFSKVEEKISKKTKGILVVHLYGRTCWSKKLESLARKYDLKIIEDNAQAIGSEWYGEKTGSLGDAGAFSFYPGKNMGALGDAGAVTTSDTNIISIIRALGNYGSQKKYVFEYQGLNSRLDEIQAAFLNIKLKYLEKENQERREIAQFYVSNLKNDIIKLPDAVNKNDIINDRSNVWHIFTIRTKYRDALKTFLHENDIETLIHYPIPPHKQNALKNFNKLKLPITEEIHNEVLSLPIYPGLKRNDLEKIVEDINKFSW